MSDGRSATARGYGEAHKRLRRKYEAIVQSGDAICCRCGGWIDPLDSRGWDLDHADHDRTEYLDGPTGPTSHAGCNRAAGSRRGNRSRAMQRAVDPDSTHTFVDRDTGRRYWWSRQWLPHAIRREK